ncbi:MAG: hypothetical protein ACRD1T_00200 [Acidimicrobiia bacterium]
MSKRQRARTRARRRRQVRILIPIVLGAAVIVAAFLFVNSRGSSEATDPTTYFFDRRDELKKPEGELEAAVTLGIAGVEEPGPQEGLTPPYTFFVSLKNGGDKAIAVADVVVVPRAGTAPGVRMKKDKFHTTTVGPGQSKQVEVVMRAHPDPTKNPPTGELKIEQFGLDAYAVVAFEDEVGRDWANFPHPTDAGDFAEVWGDFTLVSHYVEYPPDVLTIFPRRRQTVPPPGGSSPTQTAVPTGTTTPD